MTDLEYRCVIGLLVPGASAVLGVLAKKIARRGQGWRRADFYLGREFSLAGIATSITSIFVVWLKPNRVFQGRADLADLGKNSAMVLIGFVLFLLILTWHQDYEDEEHTGPDRTKELTWVGVISNVIGFGLLVASVVLMVD